MKKDKKKNSNGIIYGIIVLIVIVAVFSFFDFSDVNNSNDGELDESFILYGEYRIYEKLFDEVMFYAVEVFDSDDHAYFFHFRYLPDELEDILVEDDLVDKVLYTDENKETYKSKIYISVNPSMTGQEALSMFGLAQILWIGTEGHEGIFKIPTQTAFSSDYEGDDHPIKNCGDATPYIGVIVVDYGDMQISSDENCIILNGNDLEELRMVNEKLGYMLLGVI